MARGKYENGSNRRVKQWKKKKIAPPSQRQRNEKSQAIADAPYPDSFVKHLALDRPFHEVI